MCLTKTEACNVMIVAYCYQLFHQVQLADCSHIQHSKENLVCCENFLLLVALCWMWSQSF